MASLERHTRNVFIIGGAIIVYLFAGADLERLTVIGLRAPATFPKVFSAAAVIALFWFWWRYHVAWIETATFQRYRDAYLAELQLTPAYLSYIQSYLFEHKVFAQILRHESLTANTGIELISYGHSKNCIARLKITIDNLVCEIAKRKHSIPRKHFPGNTPVIIEIPWQFHYRHAPRFSLGRFFRKADFADQWGPHLVFAFALVLIGCKLIAQYCVAFDPAGIWGMMGEPQPVPPG